MGPHRIRVKYNETVPEIQPCAVYKYTAQSLRHKRQLVAGLKNTPYNAVHWSQLAPEEQIRFWEDYEAGRATTFWLNRKGSARSVVVVSTPPNPNAKIRPGIVLSAIRR